MGGLALRKLLTDDQKDFHSTLTFLLSRLTSCAKLELGLEYIQERSDSPLTRSEMSILKMEVSKEGLIIKKSWSTK